MPHVPLIAIVDDDMAIREALDDLVRSLGYRSVLFACAEEFLAFPHRETVDAMIVDVKMPGLSGIDLQNRLNSEPAKPPLIFMTSFNDVRTRSQAIEGGAHCFLSKPVDDHKLIRCLNSALSPALETR